MMKHISIYTFRIIFLSLLFVSPLVLTSYDDTRNFEISKNLDIFYSVFQEINTHYVDQIDPGELMSYAIDKMLESLDPYTKYIPESDVERFQMMTKGEYGGIGAMIGKRDSVMMISEIFEGYPAHKAGLLPGDKIVTIDNRSIIGKNRDEIHELLQGQPGTTIILGIQRGNSKTINTYSVKRETINLKSVPYYNMLDNNIGYVKLNQFTQNCAVEVKNACNDLRLKGAKSLILDLRDNPGGLLMEAIQITNLFVEQNKKIVYTKGKNKIAESTFY
ncbi:MAG TPA: S41 family peptidase, partial [Bacteroidales bacterium]|nr:S41 family peptidase [Bacteroidales bacterium]